MGRDWGMLTGEALGERLKGKGLLGGAEGKSWGRWAEGRRGAEWRRL